MFTGIVRQLGKVVSMKGGRLVVQAKLPRLPLGASVSVNGVCLTVVRQERGRLAFDLSPETMELTNLGDLDRGAAVNIEPALRASDWIGGHWVSGHVDGRARVLAAAPMRDGCVRMRINLPISLRPFVALKGSITVDGTSLTVTKAANNFFETVLVPHTLKATTLNAKNAGDMVNLEVDMMARYLLNFLKRWRGRGSSLLPSRERECPENVLK